MQLPVAKSHIRSVASSPADTAYRPSGVTHTLLTRPQWPSNVRMQLPVAKSHTRKVASALADIAYRPSGATHTLLMRPLCPSKLHMPPVSRSQTYKFAFEYANTPLRPS